MTSKTVRIDNISCGHCVATIERELSELEGVVSRSADAATKQLTVEWQPPADRAGMAELLDELGEQLRGRATSKLSTDEITGMTRGETDS